MADKDRLENKRILIVDDEPDILDTLEELLDTSEVVRASSFEEAKEKIENEEFDIAILDIMGVNGYRLLDMARKREMTAVMLTAHALSTEDTVKSFKEGASSYIPKEEMQNITIYLNDILEAKEQGKSTWWKWLERFSEYYSLKFTPEWQEKDKEFWTKFPYYM